MNHITSSQSVDKLGTILSIWAHPDDETFSCGAIMSAAARNSQRVVCVTATKGELGVRDEQRWPKSQLAEIRAEELKNALKILGVREHHWLGYVDGQCHQADKDAAVAKIERIIAEVRPDTILTFGPDGMTGHGDHIAVSGWATEAAKRADKPPEIYYSVELKENYDKHLKEADKMFNIYFNIDKPPLCDEDECDICFCLTPEQQTLKRKAIAAMPSQYEGGLLDYFDDEKFSQAFRCECFVRAG
jgi:LmbE family N-acetylglucosaminyl deacetylase